MAHAAMLGATGIISESDAELLIDGLSGILNDLETEILRLIPNVKIYYVCRADSLLRDSEMLERSFIPHAVENDQVALDLRMYLRGELDKITELLKALIVTVTLTAEKHKAVIMPGYTIICSARSRLLSVILWLMQ